MIATEVIIRVLSQHSLARGGIPAVEQPDAVKVVQERSMARSGIPAVEQPDAVKVVQEKGDRFGKEPDGSRKLKKLDDDPKQSIDQLGLGENVALFRPFHLPFSDHVHRLVACQCASRRLEGKKPGRVWCGV